jgi:glycosyltransferase involved in cell wall biosynthesis
MSGSATGDKLSRARPLCDKIMVCVTEDWFALSHFRPLLGTLQQLAREVLVITRSSGRLGEIEALGARAIDFNYHRSSLNPIREALTVSRLAGLMRRERPDVVHLIAMKPIVIGGLALRKTPISRIVQHMTGLGFLAISDSAPARIIRRSALSVIAATQRARKSWLLVENPDDLAFLEASGVTPAGRASIVGGAGIDPDTFSELSQPPPTPTVAAYVGRMIRPKGVDVLVEAGRRLRQRAVTLEIELYGASDEGNPEALPRQLLQRWGREGVARWLGRVSDVREIWRRAGIFVLPARSREGMPRAMLEAAASARALIVSDVPGCRHFVRDGIEGFVVPPGDAVALADALERLASDSELRQRMGEAARRRVLYGYTEADVAKTVRLAYHALHCS